MIAPGLRARKPRSHAEYPLFNIVDGTAAKLEGVEIGSKFEVSEAFELCSTAEVAAFQIPGASFNTAIPARGSRCLSRMRYGKWAPGR